MKVIVNTKGSVGEINNELKELLDYLDSGIITGEYTRQLEDAVKLVKASEERRHEYMVMKIREMELRDEGEKRGKENQKADDARAMYDDGLEPERIARILKMDVTDVEVMLGLRKMA